MTIFLSILSWLCIILLPIAIIAILLVLLVNHYTLKRLLCWLIVLCLNEEQSLMGLPEVQKRMMQRGILIDDTRAELCLFTLIDDGMVGCVHLTEEDKLKGDKALRWFLTDKGKHQILKFQLETEVTL
jgi:hypothetical protein